MLRMPNRLENKLNFLIYLIYFLNVQLNYKYKMKFASAKILFLFIENSLKVSCFKTFDINEH